MNLTYRSGVDLDDLQLNECTIRGASKQDGSKWWNLWFYVNRTFDGKPELFAVPVNPNGPFLPEGRGGKTWGLNRTSEDIWQVSPSINFESFVDPQGKEVAENTPNVRKIELWHQTPTIINVPSNEPWQK